MKLSLVAALAGVMMTVAILATVARPSEGARPIAPAVKAASERGPDLRHCQVATEPDAACEAAWAERRRRFFGQDGKAQ